VSAQGPRPLRCETANPASARGRSYLRAMSSSSPFGRRRKLSPPRRLLALGCVPVGLLLFGMVGYSLTEQLPWFDALYTATATLTSIGSDRAGMSTGARAFTLLLALGGIYAVAFAATEVLRIVITGELRAYLEKQRMEKRIRQLRGHVIVCGYGRVGRFACAELRAADIPCVVIDRLEAPLIAAREAGAHPVWGDAASDLTLRRAGIDHARALIAAAETDSQNLLITISARLLHPTLPIVARVSDDASVPKALRAGATHTVSPYAIGGRRMAEAALRSGTVDVVELATQRG
jgi:voltage-gated potassium channel